MPRPIELRIIIRTLRRNGFLLVSQSGSHAKYRKVSTIRTKTAIIPIHGKEVPYGTFRSILRQCGLTEEEFD